MEKEMKEFDINKHGVVVDLTISFWGNYAQLTAEDIGLDRFFSKEMLETEDGKALLTDYISLGRKRLVKKKDLAKISKIRWAAWYLLKQNSFQFPFGTAYFIPNNSMPYVLKEMEKLEKKFYEEVENMLVLYPTLHTSMLHEYEQLFEKILRQRKEISDKEVGEMRIKLMAKLQTKYPNVEQLRHKFYFDFVVYEIGSPNLNKVLPQEALAKYEFNAALQTKYQEKMSGRIDTFLDGVMAQLKEMVLDVTNKLLARLNGGQGIPAKTVTAFKRFTDEFRNLDFVGWDVDSKLKELQAKLSVADKDELKDEEFQKSLATDLEAVKKLVDGVERDNVLGKFKRMIREVGPAVEVKESESTEKRMIRE